MRPARIKADLFGNYVHPDWKPDDLHLLCCDAPVSEAHDSLCDPDGWPRERYFRCSACGAWAATGANTTRWRERMELEQTDS